MTHNFLPSIAFIFSTLVLIPTVSNACDTTRHSTLEREKIEISDINSEKEQANLYNFRTHHCTSLNKAHNELEVSAFLPSDETTMGIFQFYRNQGESQIDALKHTLEFNINEQQS